MSASRTSVVEEVSSLWICMRMHGILRAAPALSNLGISPFTPLPIKGRQPHPRNAHTLADEGGSNPQQRGHSERKGLLSGDNSINGRYGSVSKESPRLCLVFLDSFLGGKRAAWLVKLKASGFEVEQVVMPTLLWPISPLNLVHSPLANVLSWSQTPLCSFPLC